MRFASRIITPLTTCTKPFEHLLEARPEAGFLHTARGPAATRRARHVRPRPAGATVGQVRQVAVPSARNGDAPRQPDVKAGIGAPQPVALDFVVLSLRMPLMFRAASSGAKATSSSVVSTIAR